MEQKNQAQVKHVEKNYLNVKKVQGELNLEKCVRKNKF